MIAALIAIPVAVQAVPPPAPPQTAPATARTAPALPLPVLSLKQLTITWPPDLDAAAQKARVAAFTAVTRTITDCRSADVVAAQEHAAVVDNNAVPVASLPEGLQTVLMATPVGKATPVFGNAAQGMRVLVVCARD